MQNRVKKCRVNVQHNSASLAKRKSYAVTESALQIL